MGGLFLLLLVSPLLNSAEGFFIPPRSLGSCRHPGVQYDVLNNFQLGAGDSNIFPGDDAPLVGINGTLRVDATTLAETKKSPSPFQIQRPRWYNKNEVAIIVLLCQRLNMLDLKGVEHMLDAQKTFAKEDPVSLVQLLATETPVCVDRVLHIHRTSCCTIYTARAPGCDVLIMRHHACPASLAMFYNTKLTAGIHVCVSTHGLRYRETYGSGRSSSRLQRRVPTFERSSNVIPG